MIVLVEHFLNDEGVAFFGHWVDMARIELKKYPGFTSIHRLENTGEPSKSYLLLEFESMQALRNWSESHEHEVLLSKLKPFMLAEQKSQLFHKML